MALYLKDATFIDWQGLEIRNTCIAVEEGPEGGISLVTAVPPQERLAPVDRIIDCAGKLVTRSFACGHHHIYSALARGMPAPKAAPANFKEVLRYIWWRLDKSLDLEMVEASALATALFCAKNGVTLVIVTHERRVSNVAKRVITMRDGLIVEGGATDDNNGVAAGPA